jgi:hypothetical protein
MGQLEPPSSISRSRSHLFFIGMDGRGNWVVQDQQHLCGGLFVDRAEALALRDVRERKSAPGSRHGSRCFRARFERQGERRGSAGSPYRCTPPAPDP